MPAIRELFDLQTVDLAIDSRNQRLAEIAAHLGEEGRLPALRTEAARLAEAARAIGERQRELDEAVAALSGRIEAVEARMYGGRVTNPRELAGLQADVAMIRRQRGQEEDKLLVVLVDLESTSASLDATSKELEGAEAAWQADQVSLTEERALLGREASELDTRRRARAQSIPPTELAQYEQIRSHHAGKAVARMRNGTCESCRVALPTGVAQSVRTARAPVRCPSCGLIMLAD